MKKFYLSLVALFTMFALIPLTYAKDNKVKVYMFTKNGCSACEYAFEYFEEKLAANPDDFELVNIEVWCGTDYTDPNNQQWILGSQTALDLMQKALDLKGEDTTALATPTIMVGDYLQVGADNLDNLYEKITNYKTDKKYKDELEELAKENEIDISELTKPHGAASCDINPAADAKDDSGKYDLIIIGSIFVVLIGGFIGLIVISKK